jgi:type I restriction enzyme S subunit
MRDGWNEAPLGSVVNVVNGGTPSTKSESYWGGSIVWITTTELTAFDGKSVDSSTRTITHEGLENGPARLVRAGTTLVGTTATIGTCAIASRELTFNQQISGLSPLTEELDDNYLFYWIQHSKPILVGLSAGTSFKRISTAALKSVLINFPPLPEQRRIVDLISSVDEALFSADKYLMNCQKFYLSISNNLFNNPTIPLTKLGDYCESKDIQIGPFGSQLHASDYLDFGTPVVMPQDIVGGKISTAKIARISEEKASELSKHRLSVGDTLFARRGDLTKRAIVSESEDGWICGTGTVRVRSRRLNPQILFNSVSTDEVNAWLKSHAVGATMPNINTALVGDIPIRVPVGIEKQVLALEAIGVLIGTKQELIEKLKLTRSSLLNDLLSGSHEIPASYDKVMDVA